MNTKRNHFFYLLILSMAVIHLNACKTDSLEQKALNELLSVLHTQPEFIKVHAAEYLIWLGHKDEARKEFLHENELHGNQPKYRIGIWRVLSQTEQEPTGKKAWYDNVYKAFGDLNGPDRLHAAETLAKLKLSPLEQYPEATQRSLADESRNMQVYTQWALSYSPQADPNASRKEFLHLLASDSNQVIRMISAYIVRRTKGLTPEEWTKLSEEALAEPDTSELKKNLLNTAAVTLPEGMQKTAAYDTIRKEMTSHYQQFNAGDRIALSQALAEIGIASDIPLLESYLENENSKGLYEADSKEGADVRTAAAYAIIKIKQRDAGNQK